MEVRKLRDKATEAFAKGRFSKAAELYEDYCKAEPKDIQARLRLGDAWAKAGQRDRAISAYQFAAQGFAREGFLPRAIAASKLILELDPAHKGVQRMLAELYARKSAGGSGIPQPRPAPTRKVELPTFTEHMGVSMGPAVAPLELPEEGDETAHGRKARGSPPPQPVDLPEFSNAPPPEMELPVHAPLEVVEAPPEEELAVVAGVPVPPEPEAVQPQAGPKGDSEETALEVDLGRGPRKLAWAALSEPLFSVRSSVVEPSPPASAASAPAGSMPPGLRPRRVDMAVTPAPGQSLVPGLGSPATLLHAVEEAAIAGLKQRAAGSPEASSEVEEELLLTEEVSAEVPAPGALPNIPLFSDLPQDAFIELFERCPLRRFSKGERVFEQGSHGNAFYVICEGSVRVFRQDGTKRLELATLDSGAFFGEMALLSGAPRMASVESATDDTQLLEISAPVLAELSRQYSQVARALKKFCRERMLSNVMSTSALFEPFSRKDRRTLVEKFLAREVRKNEIIVREGEHTDGLYVVLSGEVEASTGDQVLSRLKEGELFGEISLLSKTPATATVMATRRTSLLRLPREDFDALILTHPQILVLVSQLSEQRLRRSEALTASAVIELAAEDLLV